MGVGAMAQTRVEGICRSDVYRNAARVASIGRPPSGEFGARASRSVGLDACRCTTRSRASPSAGEGCRTR
jgi:hypothetical protein